MHKNLLQLSSKYENDLLELKNQDKHCQINIDALQENVSKIESIQIKKRHIIFIL